MSKFSSVLVWLSYGISFFISFLVASVVRIFTFPFDPYNRYPNAVMMFFGQSVITMNPFWKRHYYGLDKLRDGKHACIRVANHQSFLDMPLLATLPTNMKWVSKKELFKIPIVGWLMSLAGHISIDRGAKGAAKSLQKMVGPIENGMSVMIFPEGTRSREGKLKAFKKELPLRVDRAGVLEPAFIILVDDVGIPTVGKTEIFHESFRGANFLELSNFLFLVTRNKVLRNLQKFNKV